MSGRQSNSLIRGSNQEPDERLAREIADQMAELLLRQLRLYTMGDSSSLPKERADEIYHSVLYTLKSAGIEMTQSLQEADGLSAIFRKGQLQIEGKVRRGKKLLFRAQCTKLNIPNVAYQDTYRELSAFFSAYNLRFFANAVPCMIDYQLAGGQPESEGIDYINEYVGRLTIENRFCRRFSKEKNISLLEVYVPDYRGLIFNIFEPIAHNAVGLTLLGEDPRGLLIQPEQARELARMFQKMERECQAFSIENAVLDLIDFLEISDACEREYLLKTASALMPRLRDGVDFAGIFIG